jgi:hypothetical protein
MPNTMAIVITGATDGLGKALATDLLWARALPGSATAVSDGVNEYLRSFPGPEGVPGALGVYRAALHTARQSEDLALHHVQVPVVGIGGSSSRADNVGRWKTFAMTSSRLYLTEVTSSPKNNPSA